MSETQVMFDFTLRLQPVIQFVTWLRTPCFKELIGPYTDMIGNASIRVGVSTSMIVVN